MCSITFVCLVFGYMIAFSYHLTESQKNQHKMTSSQFERDIELRNELIAQEEKNQKLTKGLIKSNTSFKIEKEFSNEAQVI